MVAPHARSRNPATLAAAAAAVVLAPGAVAWACTCPAFEGESAAYAPVEIRALDGGESALNAERARWDGDLVVTAEGAGGVRLWLRVPLPEDGVRDVFLRAGGVEGERGDTGEAGEPAVRP